MTALSESLRLPKARDPNFANPHPMVSRRGMPPPSALLGARIRRAQTACIVAQGASSVLVRPLAARRICCSEPVPGHISRPGRPRHVWFPGLISSSAVAPRALQRDKMDELGTGGPAPIFSGPFPWFFAFERLISRFRRRSSLFILILINRSNRSAIPAESHYRPICLYLLQQSLHPV